MVQSVERTLDILEALVRDEDQSISALQAQLGLPLGTLHRLLGTLVARGYAVQSAATRQYGPGPKLLEIATHATQHHRYSLQQIARPQLQALTTATGETSNLLVLQGHEVVYIDHVERPQIMRVFIEIGARWPLHLGAGKAILATWSPDALDAYCRHAPLDETPTNGHHAGEQLARALEQARDCGFTIDDEEYAEGVRSVAAPIFDSRGECIAAISISGPSTRLGRDTAHTLGPQVRAAADACSRQLGHNPLPDSSPRDAVRYAGA